MHQITLFRDKKFKNFWGGGTAPPETLPPVARGHLLPTPIPRSSCLRRSTPATTFRKYCIRHCVVIRVIVRYDRCHSYWCSWCFPVTGVIWRFTFIYRLAAFLPPPITSSGRLLLLDATHFVYLYCLPKWSDVGYFNIDISKLVNRCSVASSTQRKINRLPGGVF